MPFNAKEFPPSSELNRVKAEDEYYQLYSADIADPAGKTDRGKFRLVEFFQNDQKKAQILDIALHLAPLVVDAGTDFLFGKPVKIEVDDENMQETQDRIDAIVERTQLQRKLKESATLFQTIGHTQFKLYAEEQDGKRVACIEEIPYSYWFPNWSGVPLGGESKDVRIVVHLDNYDDALKLTKYIYIENYYMEGTEAVCAKSLWTDKGGKVGEQVALDYLKIPYASGATKEGLTVIEKTGLKEIPIVELHVRKTVLERYGQSVLKKVLPLLHEINDRLTQLSLQFLKHLNAKLQIPDGSVTRDPKTGEIKRVDLEVLLARAGEPEAKYIVNSNPLIEQAFIHIEKLVRKVAKLTHTPDSFLDEDTKGGVEKAESLRTRLMLFLRRISNYDSTYDPGIEELIRMALAIEADLNAETVPLTITFDPALPKEWQADVIVWGDALAQGLASEETAVGHFQNLEGEELQAELDRIAADKEKFMQSQMTMAGGPPAAPLKKAKADDASLPGA